MLLRVGGGTVSRIAGGGGAVVALAAFSMAAACGGRSSLDGRPRRGAAATTPCVTVADCGGDACASYGCLSGRCEVLSELACDDRDPCTADTCDSLTGACRFEPRTFDLDGDGYRGPLPGQAIGAEGACGDDCDDASVLALPGGIERCDGRDNDCNGIIDDGAGWAPTGAEPVQVSSTDAVQAMPGGLAHDGTSFGATFHEERVNWQNTFRGLGAEGTPEIPPTPVTHVDSDAFSGPLRWTGAGYATAWEDRRDGNYEIYFNRLDPHGRKLGPDLRLVDADSFSLHPDLLWDGEHFVVVWDDDRDDSHRIFGRLLSFDGAPVSAEIPMTDLGQEAESPRLAQSPGTLGMVFKAGDAGSQWVGFRAVSPDLGQLGAIVEVAGDSAVEPVIAAAGDRFFIAWHQRLGQIPGPSIWGAVLAADGSVAVPARPITSSALYARTKTWIALGDRLMLVWGADYGDGYDLYAKLLDTRLVDIGAEARVTTEPADTGFPTAAIGSSGDVGVLFRDRRAGPWQVYFTPLRCVAGP